MLPIFHEVSACSVHLSLVSVHLVPFCLFPFALRHSRYSLRSSFVPQASGTNRREPKVRGARQGTDDWRGLVSLCRPRFRPLPSVPSSPRRLLSSSPRFLRTGGKEKRRISDERRRDDEGRDGPRVVHSCLRHFRSLTRPFPPSLSSLRRSVPHALVRSSRRSLGSSLPPERRDGRMTGRSEGGKEPSTDGTTERSGWVLGSFCLSRLPPCRLVPRLSFIPAAGLGEGSK